MFPCSLTSHTMVVIGFEHTAWLVMYSSYTGVEKSVSYTIHHVQLFNYQWVSAVFCVLQVARFVFITSSPWSVNQLLRPTTSLLMLEVYSLQNENCPHLAHNTKYIDRHYTYISIYVLHNLEILMCILRIVRFRSNLEIANYISLALYLLLL